MLRMAILTGRRIALAVASSWMFIWMEPSPATSMTVCLGKGHLGADGRRQAVAHGAESAGGQQVARVVEFVELGGPHLILADLGGDDGIAAGQFVERFNHILGLDDLAVFHVGQRMLGLPFLDLFDPGLMLFGHFLAS